MQHPTLFNHSYRVTALLVVCLLGALLSLTLMQTQAQEPLPLPQSPDTDSIMVNVDRATLMPSAQFGLAAIQQEINNNGKAMVYVSLNTGLRGTVTRSTYRSAIASVQNSVINSLPTSDFTLGHTFNNIPAISGMVNQAGLAALQQLPVVAAIELDQPSYPALDNSRPLTNTDIVLDDYGETGEGIKVAVFDTGIDPDHPDLVRSVIDERCHLSGDDSNGNAHNCPGAGVTSSNHADDGHGHGTHVSGIIASDGEMTNGERGYAPDVQIIAVKVLPDNGSGYTSNYIAAVDWLMDNHPDVDIINMSLGGGQYSSVCDTDSNQNRDMRDSFNDLGAMVFGASGNDGFTQNIVYPACLSNVTAVGNTYVTTYVGPINYTDGNNNTICTDQTPNIDTVRCDSNSNALVDLLAPGAWINSTDLAGTYSQKAGTSMATPSAAGAAALVLDANPGLTNAQVINALTSTGVNIMDPKTPGNLSFPRINVQAAVDSVRQNLNLTVNYNGDTLDDDKRDRTCADSAGNCTLRAAVMMANDYLPRIDGAHRIDLPADIIYLSRSDRYGELVIERPMSIWGENAKDTVINGMGMDRHFLVRGVESAILGNLSLTNAWGGSVLATEESFLQLRSVEIYNNGGNSALKVWYGSSMFMDHSTIADNTADTSGVGLFIGNDADIYIYNSTFSNNRYTGSIKHGGGGVYVGSGTADVILSHVTITENGGGTLHGGGLYGHSNAEIQVVNSVIADNEGSEGPDCYGSFENLDALLITDLSDCDVTGTAPEFVGISPMLGDLTRPNAYPFTRVHTPVYMSPLINAVPTGAYCDDYDQTGFERPSGWACDIGAVEFDASGYEAPLSPVLQYPEDGTTVTLDTLGDLAPFQWTHNYDYADHVVLFTTTAGEVLHEEVVKVSVSDNYGCYEDVNICRWTPSSSLLQDTLTKNATYTWTVIARNPAGISGESNPMTFTIAEEDNEPDEMVVTFEGFETDADEDKQPDGWIVKSRGDKRGDKIKCNKRNRPNGKPDKIFSYSGECAFQFKGGPNEDSRLKHRPEITDLAVGDTLILDAMVNVPANPRAVVKVVVKHEDGNKDKLRIRLAESEGYVQVSDSLTITGPVRVVKVVVKHRSETGKLFLDDVALSMTPASGLVGERILPGDLDAPMLPLPPAPDGFRG